jgi:serine/threonine protein kinase
VAKAKSNDKDERAMAMTPQVLIDRYEVGPLLGAGGMAEVYEGHDRLLDRRVAIKILLSQYAHDPSFLERFRREAQSAAALSHPNIVAVFDTGTENSTPFIVMEYVQGRTLKDIIRDEGALYPVRAAEICADVGSALSAAHARGIIHRDVKPGNVMLSTDGKVKVMDFGIARAAAAPSITQTAAVVGTAQYIAPEQAQGLAVDPRSDIYSLGCCLYEMLTGQVPFTGATPVAIAYRHVREQPTPPRMLNPDIPPALEAVCLKAMAKSPEERYQTAAEFRADLERVRAGQPVAATTIGTATTQFLNRPPVEQRTAVLGAPGAATGQTSRYPQYVAGYDAAQPYEKPRSSVGWLVLALLALLLVGVIAFLVTRAVTNSGSGSGTTAPPVTTGAPTSNSAGGALSSSSSTTTTTRPSTTRTTSTPTTTTTTEPTTTTRTTSTSTSTTTTSAGGGGTGTSAPSSTT